MQWFKHESGASADAKLIKLRMRYGLEGYGLYWYCLESIARTIEAHNLTFELEHDAEIIAFQTGLHAEKVEQIMRYMCEVGLFEEVDGIITCLKMAKRMDSSMTSNPKMREMLVNIREKHGFTSDDKKISHDRVMTPSCDHHDSIMQERKTDRKKDRKTGKPNGRFTPPTLNEVRDYIQEKGYSVDPERFHNFYESKNWMVGKNKMKKWTCAVANWNKSNGSSRQNGIDSIGKIL